MSEELNPDLTRHQIKNLEEGHAVLRKDMSEGDKKNADAIEKFTLKEGIITRWLMTTMFAAIVGLLAFGVTNLAAFLRAIK